MKLKKRFHKFEMFVLLLILNLSPLFLCESGETKREKKAKGRHKADDDSSDGEGNDGEDDDSIIKQNHPRHCR